MRRREFITLLGGAAAWPLAAHAQPADGRVRRVGAMVFGAQADTTTQAYYLAAFRQTLQQLGWFEDRNLQLHIRFNAGDLVLVPKHAQELIALSPDVLVASGVSGTRALQRQTQTIPIVFVSVGDPIASGVVKSIARPEGNTTGITNLFPSIAGKWLELLKDAVSTLSRVALIFNPELPVTEIYLTAIEAVATSLGITVTRAPVRKAPDIESAINAFAVDANGGVIFVPPPPFIELDRKFVLELVTRHRLPTIFYDRSFVAEGGLMSYGADQAELYRNVASYVDRILRGAEPRDLPVQFPTKFELVINLSAAKRMGFDIPLPLLARADELIQ